MKEIEVIMELLLLCHALYTEIEFNCNSHNINYTNHKNAKFNGLYSHGCL
jgi:hypothetical protein